MRNSPAYILFIYPSFVDAGVRGSLNNQENKDDKFYLLSLKATGLGENQEYSNGYVQTEHV